MVIVDANVLIALLSGKAPKDSVARIEAWILEISKVRGSVGLPTPALAEYLVRAAGSTSALISALEKKYALKVLPFDKKAAVQCAELHRFAEAGGVKRGRAIGQPYQKIKIDRQIVSIAMTSNATMILSGDGQLVSLAKHVGLNAMTIEELPLPESARQRDLAFDGGDPIDAELQAAALKTDSTATTGIAATSSAPTESGA